MRLVGPWRHPKWSHVPLIGGTRATRRTFGVWGEVPVTPDPLCSSPGLSDFLDFWLFPRHPSTPIDHFVKQDQDMHTRRAVESISVSLIP